MKQKPTQHVVPHGNDWAVRRSGADHVTKIYKTQSAAIDAGRDIAKNQLTELFIHGRGGQIRDRDSYGGDPHPPADTVH